MRELLSVLTDQSTIIFILFCRHAQVEGGENSHASRREHKGDRRLAPESGLNPNWFVASSDSHSFELIANRGFRGRRDTPDLEFYICGMVGRHLIRAHVYLPQ